MTPEQVSYFLNQLLSVRPKYIVGGSTGLILQGAIEPRPVGDFDFCVNVPNILSMQDYEQSDIISKVSIHSNYPEGTVHDDYIHLRVNADSRACKQFNNYFYYDLFLREETKVVPIQFQGREILVQHFDEIIKYKKDWNRPKDQDDFAGLRCTDVF